MVGRSTDGDSDMEIMLNIKPYDRQKTRLDLEQHTCMSVTKQVPTCVMLSFTVFPPVTTSAGCSATEHVQHKFTAVIEMDLDVC